MDSKEDNMRAIAEPLLVNEIKILDNRMILVGDIHGCYDEFVNLLDKIDYNSTNDILISVGDLIMKGPKSKNVLDFFRKTANTYCVKGNHEYAVQRWYEYQKFEHAAPIPFGLKEGSEHQKFAATMSSEEYYYLKNLPHILKINTGMERIIVLHAGINPNKMLDTQNSFDVMHVRNMYNDCCTEKISVGVKWVDYLKTYAEPNDQYVFGHDATRGLQVGDNYIGLDSACLYGKKLSCMIYPSKEIISVDAFSQYMPCDNSTLV